MRSGFKSYALEPLLSGLCKDMMHAVASYLCRGIEAVITGLTRNQFVPKAHEGSNPSLCANKKSEVKSLGFFIGTVGRFEPCDECRGVRICALRISALRGDVTFDLLFAKRSAPTFSRAAYPSLCAKGSI